MKPTLIIIGILLAVFGIWLISPKPLSVPVGSHLMLLEKLTDNPASYALVTDLGTSTGSYTPTPADKGRYLEVGCFISDNECKGKLITL